MKTHLKSMRAVEIGASVCPCRGLPQVCSDRESHVLHYPIFLFGAYLLETCTGTRLYETIMIAPLFALEQIIPILHLYILGLPYPEFNFYTFLR